MQTLDLRSRAPCLIVVCLLAGSQMPAEAGAWSGTHKAQIEDPTYQMTAATLEVPNGWRFAGTIAHSATCHSNGNALKFTILSPDGQTAIVALPGAHWAWSTSDGLRKLMDAQHCPAVDIASAASFLVNIAAPNIEPGSKVIAVQALPAEGQASLAAQQQQAQQQNAALAARIGQKPQKVTIDGARVRIQFTRNGHAFEEQLLSVIDCTESEQPALYKQPASTKRGCSARSITITRAPLGHLDALLNDPLFNALNKSVQINPEWNTRVMHDQQVAFQKFEAANNAQFQSFTKNQQDQQNARLAQGAQFQQNLQHSTDQAMAADRAKQNAIDASAHATALHSLDRQEFRNPNTGEIIEASDQYNHQWLSSDGKTLIQTDDHTFDPNGVVDPIRESWTELEPRPLQ
jgi:hypothetical protein